MAKSVTAVLLLCGITYPLFAQRPISQYYKTSPYRNHIYMSPVQLALQTFQVAYEHDDLTTSWLMVGKIIYGLSNNTLRYGGGTEIHYRIFVTPPEAHSENSIVTGDVYFSPYLLYAYQTYEYYDDVRSQAQTTNNNGVMTTTYQYDVAKYFNYIATGGFGLLMGLRGTFFYNRLVADLYFGGGLKFSQETGTGTRSHDNFFGPAYSGVVPRINLQCGFNF